MAETATRAQPQTEDRTQVTYEDYLEIPNDGRRWEVVDGEPYVSPAPSTKHQTALFQLTHFVSIYLRDHPVGRAFFAPFDVVLGELDVVQPDFLYIRRERLGLLIDNGIKGTPDLVVEVLSESTRRLDEKVKLGLYERCGVEEYWIVDPVLETVKVRRRGEAGFGSPELLAREAGDTLTTPLLPGLEIPLAELFSP